MNKIILTKSNAIFLTTVLVLGTIVLSSPSFMVGAQAEPYYGMDDRYDSYEPEYPSEYTDNQYNTYEPREYPSYQPDYKPKYPSDNNYKSENDSSSKSVSLNKLNCINNNINVNGENTGDVSLGNKGQVPTTANAEEGYLGAYSSNGGEGYYDGYGNDKQGKGLDDCVINNNNNNTNINLGGEGNQTTPPEPEPTTATLTVKKQVFGCDNFIGNRMDCTELQNNSSAPWLDCNTNPAISGTTFCRSLPESIFDIEVLDDQNTQIQEFVGSEQGTAIPNLQPGTYTVNEIEQPIDLFSNQLADDPTVNIRCTNQGFPDGGELFNTTANVAGVFYAICFEYEDEQGNNCSTITLAAGEERTCIVKNYIRLGDANP